MTPKLENLNPETLEVVREDAILHVRLNRPAVRNAFNGTLVRELQQVFRAANTDPARVVVMSGNGKSFCAGADVSWMAEQGQLPESENRASAVAMAEAILAIARCRKPVVARIHGHALGGGCGLTAAVDIAICTDTTLFGLTEAKLGIVPAVISPFVLQKIGAGRARTLFLTAERFSGREAERIGLVHRAVTESQLDEEVQRVIGQLLSSGPAAVASAKELINAVTPLSLETAIATTTDWISKLRSTPEAKEGFSAFLEKRKPNWVEG
jgi:methylglutaconyl-CoA hydratase